MRLPLLAALAAFLFGALVTPSADTQSLLFEEIDHGPCGCNCVCNDIVSDDPSGIKSDKHVCYDERLGPCRLPWGLPLLSFVSDYHRYGKMKPKDFLQKYWHIKDASIPNDKSKWNYPERDGFQMDTEGKPIRHLMEFQEGLLLDRFGPESGHFLGAADAPFAQRSLPPDALNTCRLKDLKKDPNSCIPKDHPWNYHVYRVIKPFRAFAGPAAPWFGQPGLGTQFEVGCVNYGDSHTVLPCWEHPPGKQYATKNCSILDLVKDDKVPAKIAFLERLPLGSIMTGPGMGDNCGFLTGNY